MPIYRKPEDKAVETVTVRLTVDERRMLDHLAALDQVTLTDFIRRLIAKRAAERGIHEPPPKMPRRRPGRPKMKRSVSEAPPTILDPKTDVYAQQEQQTQSQPPLQPPPPSVFASVSAPPPAPVFPTMEAAPTPKEEITAPAYPCFGDLVERFRDSFAHRAEGTKRELEETISFLCRDADGPAILSPSIPVEELTPERLAEVRTAIRDSAVRLAKKNLYLTYLRMMLHFAVKEPDIDLRINPSRELPPFSIVESNERRRFFTGMTD